MVKILSSNMSGATFGVNFLNAVGLCSLMGASPVPVYLNAVVRGRL